MNSTPTLLGHIGAVSGSTVSVRQSPSVASGIAIIGGKSYRIGQVGSFVRIPQGYHSLYGIVSEVGAKANPSVQFTELEAGFPWMTVQLVGEIVGQAFERGISQYPNVSDEVHLVTEEDLAVVYGESGGGQIVVGRLANAEGIPVRIDLDKLVTRHSAVLGSTGSGKSTTVASLLRSIVIGDPRSSSVHALPSASILLLDIHGEYSRALSDVATVFRIAPSAGEQPLRVPFWALDPSDLLQFLMGKLDDKVASQILDRVLDLKSSVAKSLPIEGVDLVSMTADSPIPFSLKKLWFDLVEPELKTWEDSAKTKEALVDAGDANSMKPPRYKPAGMGSAPPFLNMTGVLGIRRPLDQMRSRLLDRRFDFLLHPGDWEPDLSGKAPKDLPDLLGSWLGHGRPITILDLSGIPSAILVHLIATILKIIYEGLFWGREKSEGATSRPLLVVMEEAHRYLSREGGGPARDIVQRIVKEGRKFGIGAMIVSQRPAEVDETILSQCGTFISLRLSNSADRAKVMGALPDNFSGIVESLPVLRTGEAVITGEAARLPLRCRIALPPEAHRPHSEDPEVYIAWRKAARTFDYSRLVASWRAQNPLWAQVRLNKTQLPNEEIKKMEREMVVSSTVSSVGYDQNTETLEMEFIGGRTYQYYNVPKNVYEQLMASDSKGKFHNAYIKNAFPCSRV